MPSTVDLHQATATVSSNLTAFEDIPLDVLSMEVSQDIDRDPYVSLTLTAKRPTLATLTLMDPRLYPLLLAKMTRRFEVQHPRPATLAAVSADFSTGTLAGPSAAAGPDLASFSARYPDAVVTTALPHLPSEAVTNWSEFLTITNVVENYADDTVTVTAQSAEFRLENHKRVAANALNMSVYGTLHGIVEDVVGRVGGYLSWAGGGSTPTGDITIWRPGQSAREFLNGLLEHQNLRIFATDRIRFTVAEIGQPDPFGSASIRDYNYTDGLVDAGRALSIGDTTMPWYDGVVIVYSWTDSAGVARTEVDHWPLNGAHTKALSLTRDAVYPGPGAAQGMLARSARRGFDLTITSVSSYDFEPGGRLRLLMPGDTIRQDWTIQAVTFTAPQAEMTVRLQPYI